MCGDEGHGVMADTVTVLCYDFLVYYGHDVDVPRSVEKDGGVVQCHDDCV